LFQGRLLLMRFQPRQERVVVAVYIIGIYMTVVDSTIVYTALPSIARDFHAALPSTEWVTLGYLLSLAVMVPSSGWIGDRFGTRRTYLLALCLFTGASAACGLSGTLTELIIFRVIQGIGGGLIVPVGQAMLFRAFPAERRARAAGMVALGVSLGPATGPVLGGVLVTELSWRWCFYVNVPLGIIALAVGLLFLHEHREPVPGGFDLSGFVLAGPGLALLLYAVSESSTLGWTSPVIIGTGLGGLAALAVLVRTELRKPAPMLNFRLLQNRIFRTTCLVSIFSMGVYTAYLFIMPEFLQEARGASALSSGLTTLPGAIGLWLSSQAASRAYPRIGPRRMAVGGLGGIAVVFCTFGLFMGLHTNTWVIRALIFTSGSLIAWCSIAIQAASFSTISSADTGRASALYNTQGRVAGGVGVAVLATVVSSSVHSSITATHPQLVTAFHHAFLTAAVLIAIGGLIALRIRDSDAAASMRRRARGPVRQEPAVTAEPDETVGPPLVPPAADPPAAAPPPAVPPPAVPRG
jgi:EmrB/QacA subfamily drug resistance transporter